MIGRGRFWLDDFGQQKTKAAMKAQDEVRHFTPLSSYFWLIYADFLIDKLTGYVTIYMANLRQLDFIPFAIQKTMNGTVNLLTRTPKTPSCHDGRVPPDEDSHDISRATGMTLSGRVGRRNNGSLRQICFEKAHNLFATQKSDTHSSTISSMAHFSASWFANYGMVSFWLIGIERLDQQQAQERFLRKRKLDSAIQLDATKKLPRTDIIAKRQQHGTGFKKE